MIDVFRFGPLPSWDCSTMTDTITYRVHLDGRWSLTDLYDFPHALSQTYAFSYCFDTDLPPRDIERIDAALKRYPWAGGYSVVNIYRVLENQVPVDFRPQIKEIKYASPGWLDLVVHADAIRSVATSVSLLVENTPTVIKVAGSVPLVGGAAVSAIKSAEKIAKTTESIIGYYDRIQKKLQDISLRRKKAQIERVKLDAAEAQALSKLCAEFSKLVGFKGFNGLIRRTESEEVAAKLLCAQYRRLKEIADFGKNHRATLPVDPK
jgi:hypothetical protein